MAPSFIFASNPDALSSSRFNYDQSNIQMAERDRALRQKAIDEQNQQFFRNQELMRADAIRQQDAEARAQEGMFQFAQNQQAQNQNRQDQYFQFGVNRSDRAAQNLEAKRQFDVGTGEKTREFNYNTKRLEAKDAEQLQNEVEQYKGVLSIAKAATELVKPEGFRNLPTWMQKSFPLDEQTAMERLSQDRSMARHLDKLQWDEQGQQFFPVYRTPPGFNFAATNAPVAAAPMPVSPFRASAVPSWWPTASMMSAVSAPPLNGPTNAPVVQMNRGQIQTPQRALTADIARQILQQAGGDKDKARQMASSQGYVW